jgi:hypothetical protein
MLLRAIINKFRLQVSANHWELALMANEILKTKTPGAVVECGCFQGGSAALLSVACKKAGKTLHVFDSFCGLPEPKTGDENHTVLSEEITAHYQKGAYAGSLDAVKANIARCGAIDVCRFWPGFFDATLPPFNEPVSVAFCDVDLVESLKPCIRYLWPLLGDGGVFFTHEAHHLEIAKLFHNDAWWRENLNQDAPGLIGAGSGLGLSLRKTRAGYHGSCLGMIRKNPTLTVVEQTH